MGSMHDVVVGIGKGHRTPVELSIDRSDSVQRLYPEAKIVGGTPYRRVGGCMQRTVEEVSCSNRFSAPAVTCETDTAHIDLGEERVPWCTIPFAPQLEMP